jgi:hypothetical protein
MVLRHQPLRPSACRFSNAETSGASTDATACEHAELLLHLAELEKVPQHLPARNIM